MLKKIGSYNINIEKKNKSNKTFKQHVRQGSWVDVNKIENKKRYTKYLQNKSIIPWSYLSQMRFSLYSLEAIRGWRPFIPLIHYWILENIFLSNFNLPSRSRKEDRISQSEDIGKYFLLQGLYFLSRKGFVAEFIFAVVLRSTHWNKFP
jgi:hypothetical protein